MEKWHQVYILLGTNMGDKQAQLQMALNVLSEGVCRLKNASSVYVTSPWGVTDQPEFLNQVIEIETTLAPTDLLKLTQQIEKAAGPPKAKKWGPRYLDVDILFYDDQIIDQPELQIPHPALHERDFTLIPLYEITPDLVHPRLQQTVGEMLEQSPDTTQVQKLELA